MTNEQFKDMQMLGKKITEYCRAMENFRALKEGREMLAKGLRNEYPNMRIEAIRERLWKQEEGFEKNVQLAFNEMRMCANSLGWKLDYKDVHYELDGILRKPITNLNDINV